LDEITPSSADLDVRRRRALFRSWHRGIRELDLMLGSFAEDAIASLTDRELDQYEALMDVPDTDLLSWITGQARIPPDYDTPVLRKILASRQCMPFESR
jgi:antitoxin CptB